MIKQPWFAAFLSLLLPGAGQIYAGKRMRGIAVILLCFCLFLAVIVCFLLFLLSDDDETSRQAFALAIASGFLTLLVSIYSYFDSYKAAKSYNAAFNIPIIASVKKPWLAVFLSEIFPGIEQFYNRQVGKAILFIIAQITIFLLKDIHYSVSFLLIPLCFYAAKDAFESATKINGAPETFLKPESRFMRTFIVVMIVLGALPVGEIIKANSIRAYKLESGSMLPTLEVGDHILIDNTNLTRATIRRGDVVVFKYPEDPKREFVKRVVAIGGDTIEEKSKVIYINGNALREPFTQYTDTSLRPGGIEPRDNFGPLVVPEGKYFMMGDNRDQSYDSRYWGYVPKENIQGKALKIYWSWDPVKRRVRWNRIGRALQ